MRFFRHAQATQFVTALGFVLVNERFGGFIFTNGGIVFILQPFAKPADCAGEFISLIGAVAIIIILHDSFILKVEKDNQDSESIL
jgi:hypothetical protein